ncbi:MAG TPA: Flp family type IVb pilin [Terracidiphilus sp.]|jgi:Flp pilus assembly pilin Flp
MQQFLRNLWREDGGQDLIEYSLLVTFIALVCTGFLGILGPSVTTIWQVNNNNIQQARVAAGS